MSKNASQQTTAAAPEQAVPGRWGIWMMAVRPKTLTAAVAPVVMGTALAYGDGLHHWGAALVALFCAILIQIGTNFANDYYDYMQGADTGERLGPTRVTQAGLVPPEIMKRAFVVVFGLAFVAGMYLVWRGGWPILTIGLLSILFGILYTGGPYPLGYHGLGDIFVLIFFGPVAVGGTYYVQALTITPEALLIGVGPGLISTALLTVNNLRDIHTDRETGKRTLAVRFGEGFARMEYLLCIVVAALLPPAAALIHGNHPGAFLTLLTPLIALPAIRTVFRESGTPVLNKTLAETGRLLFIYSLLFTLGWIVG